MGNRKNGKRKINASDAVIRPRELGSAAVVRARKTQRGERRAHGTPLKNSEATFNMYSEASGAAPCWRRERHPAFR